MERVKSLIIANATSSKPKKAKLAKFNLEQTVFANVAKLGRYMLTLADDAAECEVERAVQSFANYHSGVEATPIVVDDMSRGSAYRLLASIQNTSVKAQMFQLADLEGLPVYLVIADKFTSSRYTGCSTWSSRSNKNFRACTIVITRAQLLGLVEYFQQVEVGKDASTINRYISCAGYKTWKVIANDLFIGLDRLFYSTVEAEQNAEFVYRHTASVFEDKKHCTFKHKALADSSAFAKRFAHVEIDDDINMDLFVKLDGEFETRYSAGLLPQVDIKAMRFRKTGRHKAAGIYNPRLHEVAVDPRHPSSLVHEFAHAYDFSNGNVSLSGEFEPLLNKYRELVSAEPDFNTLGNTKYGQSYYTTPTEVFARMWDVWAMLNDAGGSFCHTAEEVEERFDLRVVLKMRDEVEAFFTILREGTERRSEIAS